MKVGIFDSGIGGLSVLHRAMKLMPDTHFLYYADEEHVPYGEKTSDEIRGYVERSLEFLVEQGVDAVVIACNTATSVATKEFREQFPVPIVGMEPAVKTAVELCRSSNQRILVAATPVTIAGDKLHSLLERVDTEHEADLIPLPKLVRFAEKGDFKNPAIEEYLREKLESFDLERYGALVLGCTHFNYFKEHFRRVFPKDICFVDGNEGTVKQLMRILPKKNREDKMGVTYFFSGKLVGDMQKKKIQACMAQLDRMYRIR